MFFRPRHLPPQVRDDEPTDDERAVARRRIQARRDFGAHVVTYVVVNGLLLVIWALTGGGYFWPGWVLGGWGIALVLHAWDLFFRHPVTEGDVEDELRRRR